MIYSAEVRQQEFAEMNSLTEAKQSLKDSTDNTSLKYTEAHEVLQCVLMTTSLKNWQILDILLEMQSEDQIMEMLIWLQKWYKRTGEFPDGSLILKEFDKLKTLRMQ